MPAIVPSRRIVISAGAYTCRSTQPSNNSSSPITGSSEHSLDVCFAKLESASDTYTPTMRYDDWDVILFPKDSQTPIQEFKTACYHVNDNSELLPT